MPMQKESDAYINCATTILQTYELKLIKFSQSDDDSGKIQHSDQNVDAIKLQGQ